MKRMVYVCLTVVLTVFLLLPVSANRTLPLVVDEADLLNEREEHQLLSKLEALSDELSCEIAAVTVHSLGGKSAQAYADDFYDENGYGYGVDDDGVLLLLAVEERMWAITTYGRGHRALGDRDLEEIEDAMLYELSGDRYYEAFVAFADATAERVRNSSFDWKASLGISAVIGFVLALITVSVMKGKLKSVHSRKEAGEYVIPNSMQLRVSHDRFLYRNVTRIRIENNSSGGGSHRSSSGRTHGGRSGRF